MSNIWHDIDEKRIRPEDFISVIEISKGGKKKYELDKQTGYIWTEYCIRPHTIPRITDLFRERWATTETRWTCCCFARKRSNRWCFAVRIR